MLSGNEARMTNLLLSSCAQEGVFRVHGYVDEQQQIQSFDEKDDD